MTTEFLSETMTVTFKALKEKKNQSRIQCTEFSLLREQEIKTALWHAKVERIYH